MASNDIPALGVIGGGVSGVLTAIQLMRQARSPLRIHLIESHPPAGLGIAYRTSFDEHLLNVPASGMSLFADLPDHFIEWLQIHFPSLSGAEDFVPRNRFGQYVQETFEESRKRASPGVACEIHQAKAIQLKVDDKSVGITLADGEYLQAEAVVLALGNFPPADPIGVQPDWPSGFYFPNPWDEQLYRGVSALKEILLIGSGLTALDVVIGMEKEGFTGQYHLVSTHGLLPQPHQAFGEHTLAIETYDLPDRLTALALYQLFRQEVARAGSDWRAVIQAFRPLSVALWLRLPLGEQRQFLRRLAPWWNVHRHRIAPDLARQIEQLRSSGRLRVWKGRAGQVQEGVAELRLKKAPYAVSLPVQRIINCTGPQGRFSRIALHDPLVGNLVAQGLLRDDATQTGVDAMPDGHLVQADGQPSPALFTLGTPMRGVLFECTSVPEIRQQATELAASLLEKLASRQSAADQTKGVEGL
jgi:uncharacterized NAD(P)/FAD-binding protein YdhS